ncbi:MAG: NYN domain-containing protein [Myxococcota bacterium]
MRDPQSETHSIAVFIDLENVAIGVRDARYKTFEIQRVLERLLEKGNIVVKKGYADWDRYKDYKRSLHEAGVELTEMPGSKLTGKNSADIKMVVDALELSYTKPHIDIFALISGDSDFSPLVTKLRENDRHTIGIGVKNSTSPMLINACDEFVFYDDLVRRSRASKHRGLAKLPKKTREAFALLLDTCEALQRENKELHGSLVKETMKRKQPQFSEEYHGYRSFSRLLEDAQKHKLIHIHKDSRSGTYVIDDVFEDAA